MNNNLRSETKLDFHRDITADIENFVESKPFGGRHHRYAGQVAARAIGIHIYCCILRDKMHLNTQEIFLLVEGFQVLWLANLY